MNIKPLKVPTKFHSLKTKYLLPKEELIELITYGKYKPEHLIMLKIYNNLTIDEQVILLLYVETGNYRDTAVSLGCSSYKIFNIIKNIKEKICI